VSSTCEDLKVLHWIKDIQMPTIDEESASIHSDEITTDEMLKFVYGNSTKDEEAKKYHHKEKLPTKDPYLSESVAFDTSSQRYSCGADSSVMNDDDFQGIIGDYYCDNNITKNKQNGNINYDATTSGLDEGYYADYNGEKTASLSHNDQYLTVPLKPADEATLEVVKESEIDDDMPYIPASDDTGVHTGSESPIPTFDGGYTSCSIAIRPTDYTTSCIPAVTTPT